jgi:hypothetical protein
MAIMGGVNEFQSSRTWSFLGGYVNELLDSLSADATPRIAQTALVVFLVA